MDRYTNREKVGEGEFGEVYRATDKISGNLHALKKIKGESDEVLKELKPLMKIKHRGIVQLKGLIQSDEGSWLAMEYCDSGNLEEFWKEQKPGLSMKYTFMTQLSDTLAYLHDNGIAHRDIKPANILITRAKDGQYHPKFADFGVSKVQDITEEFMQTRAGTELFIAPEVLGGKYTNKADIFSLGIIFRAMVFDTYVLLDESYYLGVIFMAEGIFPIALGTAMFNKKGMRFDIEPEKMKHNEARNILDTMLDPDYNERPSAKELNEQIGKLAPEDFDAVLAPLPDVIAKCKPKQRQEQNVQDLGAGETHSGDSLLRQQMNTTMQKILKGKQLPKSTSKKPTGQTIPVSKKPSQPAPQAVLGQRQKSPEVSSGKQKMLTGFPLRAPKQWPPPKPDVEDDTTKQTYSKSTTKTAKKTETSCAQLGLDTKQLTETKQLISDWERMLISESSNPQEQMKAETNASVLITTLNKVDRGGALEGGEVQNFATAWVQMNEQVKQYET